jgi:hypothetical protein
MPKEAFYEAEFDGMQISSAGVEEHGLRSMLLHLVDRDSGFAVLRIDLGYQDLGYNISVAIHLPSRDFVGSCDTSTRQTECSVWYNEFDSTNYSAQYASHYNSVALTGHGPGSVEITSNEGNWIEGTWDTKMFSYYPVDDPDDMPMHSMKGSFRVEKSSQWSWWPGELP